MASDEVIERVGWAVRANGFVDMDVIYPDQCLAEDEADSLVDSGRTAQPVEIHAAPEGYVARLLADRDRLLEREKHFAAALGVADGGRYRNDWDARIEALLADRDRLRDLVDRLKLEAQIHAGEARCQTATVHECYQAASGATGERGTWHGANPVRERIEALEADRDRMRDALKRWKELLTSDHVRIQTNDIGHDLAVSQLMEDTDRALNPNENEEEA